jgi:polar amino acid transport system permease protein
MTEIVRAGINSVPIGQWDACKALGYSKSSMIFRIILPQASAAVLPALIGELEQLLKSTSLLATIGITELTRNGMNIISRELNPIPIYAIIAVIYLALALVLQSITIYTEKKFYAYR